MGKAKVRSNKVDAEKVQKYDLDKPVEFNGEHFYSFVVGNNIRYTFIRYFEQLVDNLDNIIKNWRNNKVIILDYARFQTD